MKKLIVATAVVGMMSAPFASALDDGQTYIEVKATSSNYDVDGYDDRATGLSFAGGYKISESKWAIEAGYADLGKSTSDDFGFGLEFDLEVSTVFVSGKYLAEIQDKITAFGIIGLNSITAEASVTGASAEETETKLMYGGGAQYDVTNALSVTASYVAYSADITTLQAGVGYKF